MAQIHRIAHKSTRGRLTVGQLAPRGTPHQPEETVEPPQPEESAEP
jgi:hypothetical protein